MKHTSDFLDPLLDRNPITVQVLGVCSALAVTTRVDTAAVMSIAVIGVLLGANLTVSLLRRWVPGEVRIIVQLTIVASLVMMVDQLLMAYAYDISLELSVFVGLIITNCIIMGRAEAFAMHNPPGPSVLDALGNGLGYSLILLSVALVREVVGFGTVAGLTVLPSTTDGGWFRTNGLMALAPAAFLLIGVIIWLLRWLNPSQIEEDPYARALPRPGDSGRIR